MAGSHAPAWEPFATEYGITSLSLRCVCIPTRERGNE